MTRYTKRGGQVWIKIFPDKPVTKQPAETRMGSGKGSPEYWVAVVKPGRIMFEIAGVSEEVAREALRLASHKPVSYTHLDVYKRQPLCFAIAKTGKRTKIKNAPCAFSCAVV